MERRSFDFTKRVSQKTKTHPQTARVGHPFGLVGDNRGATFFRSACFSVGMK